MPRKIRVTIVGGGSCAWAPMLTRDIILTPGLEDVSFRLLDIDLNAAEMAAAVGRRMSDEWELGATFAPTNNEAKALDGADFVIITISTGGFDAMHHDVHLPEKYGIYQTVGDTVGPGGWSRSLRNIPVFIHLAAQFRKYCPRAAILNYTNPMSVLTRTLSLCTDQPVVGLCHGLYENYATLQSIFGLKSESDVKANVAGINHFFWLLGLKIKGRDGYAMLRRKMRGGSFAGLVTEAYVDGAGFHSDKLVTSELLEQYGVLPYVGDRHIAEFLPHYLAPDQKNMRKYRLERTSVKERREKRKRRRRLVRAWASGRERIGRRRSREAAADIIRAMTFGEDFVDVMNVPNRGQVSNLPAGAVVETLGVINRLGFTPLAAGALPPSILDLVLPHVRNQEMTVRAGMEGDRSQAFDALINEPVCSHLTIPQVRKMGEELMHKTRRWLPQFFGRRAR